MVADEEVLLIGFKLLHAAIGKLGNGTGNDLLVDAAHHLKLEVADGAERKHHLADVSRVAVGIDVGAEQSEEVALDDALHGSGYFLIVIGTNVVEVHVFDYFTS